MILDKIVEGKHKGETFRYADGKMYIFERNWDKTDIQTLVEIANLLEVEGYPLKKCTGSKQIMVDGIFGPHMIDKKIYEGDEE